MKISHEWRVGLIALGCALPPVVIALALIWTSGLPPKATWTLGTVVIAAWIVLALAVPARVTRPLQNLASVVASFREGDFSIRARGAHAGDALGIAALELNALGDALREQRLGALEASALLSKVIAEIDVAVFAFDGNGRLKLANRAAERLLDQGIGRALRPHLAASPHIGEEARMLGLEHLLALEAPRTVTFPEGAGEWELGRSTFRLEGRTHTLVVLTPIERALREREREAWQRLVRVLGHEINNSLAPIQSIAESSLALLHKEPRPPDADEDLARGLEVIAKRSAALGRFLTAFARLARLPPPRLAHVAIAACVERTAALETRLPVTVEPGPSAVVRGDADQLEQLLINLIRNAVDASLETGGGVRVTWTVSKGTVELKVIDEGPGLVDDANLFVPFFTTKPEGSGIGLALSRQVAEAHGGKLTLKNRAGARGCEAVLVLPRA